MVELHGLRIVAVPDASKSVFPVLAIGSFLKTTAYVSFETLVSNDEVELFFTSSNSTSEHSKALSFARSFLAGQNIPQSSIKASTSVFLDLEPHTQVIAGYTTPNVPIERFGQFKDTSNLVCLSDHIIETFLGAESRSKGMLQVIFRRMNIPRRYRRAARLRVRQFDTLHRRNELQRASDYYNELVTTGCYEAAVRTLVTTSSQQETERLSNEVAGFFGQLRMTPVIYPFHRRLRRLGPIIRAIRKRHPYSSFICSGKQLSQVLTLPQTPHRGFRLASRTEFGPPPQPPTTANESIRIGTPIVNGVHYRDEQRINIAQFTGHAAVWGGTGEGKSRLVASLAVQFSEMGKHVLIIDPKGDYLDLLGEKGFLYLKIGSNDFPLGINIFQIPDYIKQDADYIELLKLSLMSAIGKEVFGPQMTEALGKAIAYTVHHGGCFPSFLRLLRNPHAEKLLKMKGYQLRTTFAALENRMNQLVGGSAGEVFRVKKSTIPIPAILENNVILDISAFEQLENDIGRRVFLEVLIHLLFHWLRLTRSPTREHGEFMNIIAIDEVQKVLPQRFPLTDINQQTLLGRTPWSVRAYGVAMIFAGTEPTVEYPIFTQPTVNILFRSKHDPRKLSSILNITLDEYRALSNQLDKRLGIVSEGGARPYIVRTPDFFPDPVTEEILAQLRNNPVVRSSRKLFERMKHLPSTR